MCTGAEVLVMMAASTAISAYQKIEQGEQEADYRDFQAAQAEADSQAEREAGQVRAEKVRRAGKVTQSEAVASLAASGVEVGAGTPLQIETAIERNTEEDALNEILFGERKGRRLTQDAQVSRAAGGRARNAGYMAAAGSILSGGAQIGKGWKRAANPIDWGATGDFPGDAGAVMIA